MKNNSLALAIGLCCFLKAPAQQHKLNHYSIAFTTLHTAFPFSSFSALFVKEFHPGFQVGTGFNWKTREKHDWFQTFDFGYSYHRFLQHSFALYSELGYRYKFLKTFSASARLGAGYLHALPVGKIYKLNDEGNYVKKTNFGRPQVMAGFSLELNKKITTSGHAVFLAYQQRLQLPFIKSYVPLLPSNILMAGVKIPVKNSKPSTKK